MNAFIQILIPTTELNSHKKILEMKSFRLMRNVCIVFHNHFSTSRIGRNIHFPEKLFVISILVFLC